MQKTLGYYWLSLSIHVPLTRESCLSEPKRDYRKIAMANWSYKCYNDGRSSNFWQKWYDDISPAVQGKHDAAFENLETKTNWSMPKARHLRDGLYEVRLTGKVAWRIFGYIEPQEQVFVVIAIGNHKGPVYNPRNVIKTSRNRIKEIEMNTAEAKYCERPGKT